MFWSVTQVYRRDKKDITLIRHRFLSKGKERKEETKREGGMGREEGRREGEGKRKKKKRGRRDGGQEEGRRKEEERSRWECAFRNSRWSVTQSSVSSAEFHGVAGSQPHCPPQLDLVWRKGDGPVQTSGSGGKDVNRAQRRHRHRA